MHILDHYTVEVVSCFHECVSQIRVLVEGEFPSTKRELVFVVAFLQLFRHAAVLCLLKSRLEYDLRTAASQIKDCCRRRVIRTTDFTEKIVRSNPRVDALIFAIHYLHASFLFAEYWEWVLIF